MSQAELEAVVAFVNSIGLPLVAGRPDLGPAFIPDAYCWIRQGVLYYHPTQAHPGDFLHEAGHLAVLPGHVRSRAHGDVDALELMGPISGIDHDDASAIAWSYAAALTAGVDPWLAFEHGFTDDELARNAFDEVRHHQHEGINCLVDIDMTTLALYPKMDLWLCPDLCGTA